MGAIDASVHTIITRKVTAPALFDETPVGLRGRRTMVEGAQRLEESRDNVAHASIPTLDIISAVVFFDYQQFRYGQQPWLPDTPSLRALAEGTRQRASFQSTDVLRSVSLGRHSQPGGQCSTAELCRTSH